MCSVVPLQLAPPEACFYLPGQPSDDSAVTDYRTCTHTHTQTYTYTDTHFLSLCPSGGLVVSVPRVFPFFSSSVSSGMRISRCVWIHASFTFTSTEGHIQVVRENKKANTVSCLLSPRLSVTSNLYLMLCYCIIVLLDSIQQEVTERNRPIQTHRVC